MLVTKALTICQPYAHLICVTGDKLVENRTWWTAYRGWLAIHAGKSRDWMIEYPHVDPDSLPFGAIVGVAWLLDCVKVDQPSAHRKYPWLAFHEHANGPYCFLLGNRQRLRSPLPWKGAQGLWNLPPEFELQPSALEPTPPCKLTFEVDLRTQDHQPTT